MTAANFEVIPAIDLMDGKCVRLLRGEEKSKSIYSNEPAETAKRWAAEGAKRLHVVDLDGAFKGEPKNLGVVKQICEAVDIPVQVGGGIRKVENARAVFDAGVERIIVGTRALRDLDFIRTLLALYGERVCVGVDAREGKVGEVCLELGRKFILVDKSKKSLQHMAKKFHNVETIEWINFDPLEN